MYLRKLKWAIWYPISVDIERALRKLRIKIDRLYRKCWLYIFTSFILLNGVAGAISIKHDYDLLKNYARLDAQSSGIYVDWRTDGSPGQEPEPVK
jgi:hypothetical protein